MNEELLISLVSQYREIYDTGDHRYHDEQRRKNIWQEIGDILKQSATECRDKWKRIRDNYRRAKKLRQTKSGQAAGKSKPIRYEKELEFLNSYISNEEETLTNLPTSISDDENEIQQNISSPSTPISIHTESSCSSGQQKRKKNTSDSDTSMTSTNVLFQSYLEKKNSQHNNETDTVVEFFTNLGKTVKTLPEDMQIRIKCAVFNIVNNAEAELLERRSHRFSQPATALTSQRHEHNYSKKTSSQTPQPVTPYHPNTQNFQSGPSTKTCYSSPSPLGRTNLYFQRYDDETCDDSTSAEIGEFFILPQRQNE